MWSTSVDRCDEPAPRAPRLPRVLVFIIEPVKEGFPDFGAVVLHQCSESECRPVTNLRLRVMHQLQHDRNYLRPGQLAYDARDTLSNRKPYTRIGMPCMLQHGVQSSVVL